MERPILINGFPRSGTTYLYRYLQWKYGKALFEPVVALRTLRDVGNNNVVSIIDALKKNPFATVNSAYRVWWLYNVDLLREYMERLKGIPIKEITLHFYLGEDFIKSNWEPFHIIRHPADVYMSFLSWGRPAPKMSTKVAIKVLNLMVLFGIDIPLRLLGIWATGKILATIFAKDPEAKLYYEDAFIMTWTITNYYAIKVLDKNHLIAYNRKEDYYKLSDFEDFERKEPIKIKEYPNKEKLAKEFKERSKRLGINEMYEELMSLLE